MVGLWPLLGGLSSPARAEELPLTLVARIRFEERRLARQTAPLPGEARRSQAERSALIAADEESLHALYARHGTDAKTFARRTARLSLEEDLLVESLVQRLEEAEFASRAAEEDGPSPSGATTDEERGGEDAGPPRSEPEDEGVLPID